MLRKTFFACGFVAASVAVAGCGGEKLPEFGQVVGTLSARGKPLKGMAITFMPDPGQGNNSPINASATTDEQGNYSLRYGYKDNSGAGAPVGWHLVTVLDTRYSSIPQGVKLPPRLFPLSYSDPSRTPLKFEVKPGEQTIDIDLK